MTCSSFERNSKKHKCKQTAETLHQRTKTCHTHLKAFEQRKRKANLQYLRDISQTIQHDLRELDAIAKTLMEDEHQIPVEIVPDTEEDVFTTETADDEFFEAE